MHLQASSSTEEFMNELPKFDDDLSKQRDDAEAAGEVSCLILITSYSLMGNVLHYSALTIMNLLVNDCYFFSLTAHL